MPGSSRRSCCSNEDKNILTADKIEAKIKDGSSFTYNGVTHTAMVKADGTSGDVNGRDAAAPYRHRLLIDTSH